MRHGRRHGEQSGSPMAAGPRPRCRSVGDTEVETKLLRDRDEYQDRFCSERDLRILTVCACGRLVLAGGGHEHVVLLRCDDGLHRLILLLRQSALHHGRTSRDSLCGRVAEGRLGGGWADQRGQRPLDLLDVGGRVASSALAEHAGLESHNVVWERASREREVVARSAGDGGVGRTAGER